MSTRIFIDPVLHAFAECGLHEGLCLGSKSGYYRSHRNNQFVANANVFSQDGKLWWGDLDLRVHASVLERVAKQLNRRLFVLWEMDGRFGREERPIEEVLADAIWHTGGKRRVAWEQYYKGSGLTRQQFADIALFPRYLFTRPLPPERTLQWERRLSRLQRLSQQFSNAVGLEAWGAWWIQQPSSGEPSPIDRLNTAKKTKQKLHLPPPPGVNVWMWDIQEAWRPVQRRFPWRG